MRRIGDLMKELGFNSDSSIATQKAFIRHLVKAAEGPVSSAVPESRQLESPRPAANLSNSGQQEEETQLTFDENILGKRQARQKR